MQHPLDPSQLLTQLLGVGCWDAALALADATWAVGSPNHLGAMSEVVGALAGAAARLQVSWREGGGREGGFRGHRGIGLS